MTLSKCERAIYVGAPWLFGVVLTITGIIATAARPQELHGILLICSGLVCTSLFCACSLLAKGGADMA